VVLKLTLCLEVNVITKCETDEGVVLRVFGSLTGSSVHELERRWRDARQRDGVVQVDLCATEEIDSEGRVLIGEMFANGVELFVGARGPRRIQ
jgi:ABC-type transporter Mla MlaB component